MDTLDRRHVLATALGAFAGAAGLSRVAWAEATAAGEIPKDRIVTDAKLLKLYANVASAASACATAADACVGHCQRELIAGKGKAFARCATTSLHISVIADAVAKLAAYRAKSLGAFLDGCIEGCKACEEACAEHKAHFGHGMHLECKECLDACRTCREACEALKKAL
jgi:Cys-rich four helix bundle protein (predicted Tat secretion target)